MAQNPKLVWTDVDSSNVESVAYDGETKTLAIKYVNGGLYSYDAVDMQVYTDLVHAESVGKFLNQQIKGRYSFLKWFSENELLGHLTK